MIIALLGAAIVPGLGAMDKEKEMSKEEIQKTLINATNDCDVATIEHMLKLGADANGSYTLLDDFHGGHYHYVSRPLVHAAKMSRPDIIQLLLTYGASVNATDNANCTALDYSVYHSNIPLFTLLLKHNAYSNNALHTCCYYMEPTTATLLLMHPRTDGNEVLS